MTGPGTASIRGTIRGLTLGIAHGILGIALGTRGTGLGARIIRCTPFIRFILYIGMRYTLTGRSRTE